jgi:8-oxo-dGTP diphosphatase
MTVHVLTDSILQKLWHLLSGSLQRAVIVLIEPGFTVGVSAVLLNDRREVLFLRTRFRYPDLWCLPGGFVQNGEPLEDALRREIREETGYSSEVLCLIEAKREQYRHVNVCYLCRVVGGNLVIDRREVIDARFVPPHDVPVVSPGTVRTVELALQALETV